MRKGLKLISCALFALTIAGCSCSNPGVVTRVPNATDVLSGSKTDTTLTTQDIYEYVRTNNQETYNKIFMSRLLKKVLEDESEYTKDTPEKKGTFTTTYESKLEKYFKENFLEKDEYKVDGEFDEELLVASLRNKMYKINEDAGEDSFTHEVLGLDYDYSEYIEAEVDYLIYMEMLKEDYISSAKSNILDKSKSRIITVYSTDNLEDMEEVVKDLFDKKYATLKDLEQTKIDEAKKEIGRQYCENLGLKNEYYTDEDGKIIETCSPTKSSYDSSYNKFTTCENGRRCDLYAGLLYQIEQAEKTEYLTEQVINKDSKDILYQDALSLLLREDVKDYLLTEDKMKQIFDENNIPNGSFLMTNLSSGEDFNEKSIILSSAPNSTCYIVLVRTVDSSDKTSIEDKQKAMELLHDKVGETSVLIHYLDKADVDLIDSSLIDSYKTLIK